MFSTSFRMPTEFALIPAGCIHWPHTNKSLFNSWLDAMGSEDCFTILMGDSLDFARTHYRKHLHTYKDDLNSPEAIDEWVRKEVDLLASRLQPFKHRILGALLGNHYWTFLDGTNSEQYLCQKLGIRYLGPQAAVRLDLYDSVGRRGVMTLYAHHHGGSTGSRTSGGDINALLKQESIIDADIYCLGHTHDTYGKLVPKHFLVQRGRPQIQTRTMAFLRTGCFYQPPSSAPTAHNIHHPSYPAVAGYAPKQQGFVTLDVSLRQHGNNRIPEMKVSF